MSDGARSLVVFELNHTLAAFDAVSDDGEPRALHVYEGVPELIQRIEDVADVVLIQAGVDPDNLKALVSASPLGGSFVPPRIVATKGSYDEVFAQLSGMKILATAATTVYVGPNTARRALVAEKLGWRPCPHPRLAYSVVTDTTAAAGRIDHVAYTRRGRPDAKGEWCQAMDRRDFVPIHVEETDDDVTVHVLAAASVATTVAPAGWTPTFVAENVAAGDVFEIQTWDLEETQADFDEGLAKLEHKVLDGNRILVVAPDDTRLPHPDRAPHGHTVAWLPSVALFHSQEPPPELILKELPPEENRVIAGIQAALLAAHHGPLCGDAPLLGTGRYVAHRGVGKPDNDAVVVHLLATLRKILPPTAVQPLAISGSASPARNVEARIVGRDGPDSKTPIVVVGAHIDSHAIKNDVCPKDSTNQAYGADDDASGMAALLSIAEIFARLAPPRLEVRLVFFNCEECGFYGSEEYAANLAASKRQVAAMIQIDMIGWRDDRRPREFEVHGPGSGHEIGLNQRSEAIAKVIDDCGRDLGYTIGRTRPGEWDGLALRSDHRSFYAVGYPACLVTEPNMAFAGVHPSRPEHGNPSYHTACDRCIDFVSAAAITRAIAAAVRKIANQEDHSCPHQPL